MKTVIFFCVVILLQAGLFSQDKKIFKLEKAYTYQEAATLVSETDLYCSFIITKKIPADVIIVGSHQGDVVAKTSFSDHDKLVINKGARDGVKQGGTWLVMGAGRRIPNPFSSKSLGIYYLKKSLAEVIEIFEDTAVVTLKNGCSPVHEGDILIPFQPEELIFKKQIEYTDLRLPESPFEGQVVFMDTHMGLDREVAGTNNYVAVDLGKALLKKGDFLLFYKLLKKNLPPVITGLGIVISTQNTNSTVKILESSYTINVGDRVVHLPDEGESAMPTSEDIPILDSLKGEEEGADVQKLEIDILFELDGKTVDPMYDSEFEKIKQFIQDKDQFLVVLKGYACSIGGLEHNLKLSQERVENVKEVLISRFGIEANFIETSYFGEEESPFDNSSEEQRRKNRLVQIQVIAK